VAAAAALRVGAGEVGLGGAQRAQAEQGGGVEAVLGDMDAHLQLVFDAEEIQGAVVVAGRELAGGRDGLEELVAIGGLLGEARLALALGRVEPFDAELERRAAEAVEVARNLDGAQAASCSSAAGSSRSEGAKRGFTAMTLWKSSISRRTCSADASGWPARP